MHVSEESVTQRVTVIKADDGTVYEVRSMKDREIRLSVTDRSGFALHGFLTAAEASRLSTALTSKPE